MSDSSRGCGENQDDLIRKRNFEDLVRIKLGGIYAVSPEIYKIMLYKLARSAGRELNYDFRKDVNDALRSMPCGTDPLGQ